MISSFIWTPVSIQRNTILRAYEPIQPYFFLELARWYGVKVFFDVGANVGSYSLMMTGLDSITEIHSFEPTPPLYEQLLTNIKTNGFEAKIFPHQIALSSSEGTMPFAIVGKFSGANGLVETHLHSDELRSEVINVEVDRLDNIIDESLYQPDDIIAMKIDVEGHEKFVLLGAEALLKRNNIIIQIESYDELGRGTASALPELLAECGFEEIWSIGADRYYVKSNRKPSMKELLSLLQVSHENMIQDFRLFPDETSLLDGAITRCVLGDIHLSITGVTAKKIRIIRDYIKTFLRRQH